MAIRLRYLADLNPSKSELKGLSSDTEVSFLPMEAIGERGDLDLSQTRPLGEASSGYTFVRDGDVVIAKITPCFENGKGAYISGLINGIGFGTTELIVVRAKKARINPRFLSYVFQSPHFRKPAEGHMTGAGGQKRVPDDFVRDFRIDVTDCTLQDKIVRYLDRETAEIDALIERQERLIALLEEKRQAFISEAVTKGLDPTAPMKDSGIPWLGKVPQHWQVSPVKRLISILTDYTANGSFASLAENVEYFESGYARLVRLTDLRCNLENEGLYVSESAYEFLGKSKLFGGELLFANVGANAGYVCLMPDGHGACTLGPNMYLIRFKDNVTSNAYMERVLTSDVCRSHLDVAMTSTAQPKLSKDDVKELFVAIPQSTQEQAHILDTLSKHGSEIDDVRDASRRQILLLQERRAALISAAVTGKIDVTGRV